MEAYTQLPGPVKTEREPATGMRLLLGYLVKRKYHPRRPSNEDGREMARMFA